MSLRRKVRDMRRLRHILQVLVRYGFGYVIDRFHLDHNPALRAILGTAAPSAAGMPASVRLRRALEELGPAFIKLGQVLSMRPDLVSVETAQELEKLQDKVSPFSFDAARDVIERELEKPLRDLFVSFHHVPFACASLAQAHAAILADGTEAVVKIQRPGIEDVISTDLDILYELARLAARHYGGEMIVNPVALADEFAGTLRKELDFISEADNAERFRRRFADDPAVVIPSVFLSLSCRRVITLSRVRGIKITDKEALIAGGYDLAKIARNGARAVLKQIFLFGIFHADPHAGNIMVLPGNRIAFIDFGMVGRINGPLRERLSAALVGVIYRDVSAVRDAFLALGLPEQPVDVVRFDADIDDFLDRYYGRALGELNVGRSLLDLFTLVARHRVRLPPDLFFLSKVLITIEGIGRTLDPSFNLVEEARPFVEELRRRRHSPGAIADDIERFAAGLYRFAQALPRDLADIFNKLKHGTLKVEFEHRGLEDLTAQIARAASRIALSLVITALVIGSSIIVLSNRGPRYAGFPVMGLIGYIAAAIIGFWLIITILRSGKY